MELIGFSVGLMELYFECGHDRLLHLNFIIFFRKKNSHLRNLIFGERKSVEEGDRRNQHNRLSYVKFNHFCHPS